MWASRTIIHPSKRRFKTRLALNGALLEQELSGTQQRDVEVWGASMDEYEETIRESEASGFIEELDHSASEQVHFGIDELQVQGSGMKRILPGETVSGEYEYIEGTTRNSSSNSSSFVVR